MPNGSNKTTYNQKIPMHYKNFSCSGELKKISEDCVPRVVLS